MMEYYYTEPKNVSGDLKELTLTGSEFEHVVKVLRKKTGEEITVTDGEGNVYLCVISVIRDGKASCTIHGKQRDLFEPRVRVRLFMSPLKNRERFEFAVEKTVELGVDSIVPVITTNTVKRSDYAGKKTDRIRKIIIRAMCQSQRCRLPEFHESVKLNDLLKETQFDQNKFVMYEFSNVNETIDAFTDSNYVSLLIGPEGGFDEKEIELLIKNGWKTKSLGSRKLRAETAAIVSVYEIISKQ